MKKLTPKQIDTLRHIAENQKAGCKVSLFWRPGIESSAASKLYRMAPYVHHNALIAKEGETT